ncbi:2-hydroxyisoflavanone dehydratase [Bertholletia excelsa]
MDPAAGEVAHEFPPFFRVYKDGRVERLQFLEEDAPPLTNDPNAGFEFKDVLISPETAVKARIFKPRTSDPSEKLPLVVHYHGGGFCLGSALGPLGSRFLATLTREARVVAVSVEYRLAPEHPLPAAFDDSYAALQWIATHSNGQGPDPWINHYADFNRVFVIGESAGATIAHVVAVRAGAAGPTGLTLRGAIIVHPYFAGSEPDKMIQYLYPGSSATDEDPTLSPKSDPNLAKMGCSKVLVFVAENDWLRSRGLAYYETLKKSSWGGSVELVENEGEGHCFHVFNPSSEKFGPLMQKWLVLSIKIDG